MSTSHCPIQSIEHNRTGYTKKLWRLGWTGKRFCLTVFLPRRGWETNPMKIQWSMNQWTEHLEGLDRNQAAKKHLNQVCIGWIEILTENYTVSSNFTTLYNERMVPWSTLQQSWQNHTETVPPSRPRSSTVETPGCWWRLPLEGTRKYQKAWTIQSHEWQRPKVSTHFEGTINMHSEKSRLATSGTSDVTKDTLRNLPRSLAAWRKWNLLFFLRELHDTLSRSCRKRSCAFGRFSKAAGSPWEFSVGASELVSWIPESLLQFLSGMCLHDLAPCSFDLVPSSQQRNLCDQSLLRFTGRC